MGGFNPATRCRPRGQPPPTWLARTETGPTGATAGNTPGTSRPHRGRGAVRHCRRTRAPALCHPGPPGRRPPRSPVQPGRRARRARAARSTARAPRPGSGKHHPADAMAQANLARNPPRPTRRAPTSSGRVAPGRRSGRHSDREKITTADSRFGQGPGIPQIKQRPVALDVAWASNVRCASANRSSAVTA